MTATRVRHGLLARSVVGGLAALCLNIAAQNAFAGSQDDDGVKTVRVKFNDLDLSRQAGAETLYKRIQRAARTVCSEHMTLPYPSVRTAYRDCFNAAVADAVAKVNKPALAAFHQEQIKRQAS